MKQKTVIILILISSSIFAKNQILLEEIAEVKVEIQSESKAIGVEASQKFKKENNDSRAYIEKSCQSILVNFDYLDDKNIVEHILFPNCIEFALEAMKEE
jgi:hypothetical protein